MPGKIDPLGDSLSRSLASIVYNRPASPKPWPQSSGHDVGAAVGPARSARSSGYSQQRQQQQARQPEAGERDASGVLYVSHVTKEFNDRHVWVDGRGNLVTPPETRVIETQKYATLVEKPVKTMEQRAKEREEFSLELWKKVNPGYMPTKLDISQYQDEHSFVPEDLQLAKGREKDWKNHLLKTDTNKYVEAVARAKVFASIAGAQKK